MASYERSNQNLTSRWVLAWSVVLLSTSKVVCRHVKHNYRYHIDNVKITSLNRFARVKRLLCGGRCPGVVHNVFRYPNRWQSGLISLAPDGRSQSLVHTHTLKKHLSFLMIGYSGVPNRRDRLLIYFSFFADRRPVQLHLGKLDI